VAEYLVDGSDGSTEFDRDRRHVRFVEWMERSAVEHSGEDSNANALWRGGNPRR